MMQNSIRNPYEIIKRRHVTEKSRMLQELQKAENNPSVRRFELPKYVFIVDPRANKQEIANALEEIYREKNIKVVSVNTLNVKGKEKRRRGRVGKTASFKKAIVTLSKGDLLDKHLKELKSMLKTFRPITPSTRQLTLPKNELLTRVGEGKRATVKPTKSLLKAKKRISGRNSTGRICVRHRGGGHKRHYRIVDFKRDKENIPARVASIEYDPNRSAYIALLNYADGEKRYILAAHGLEVGQIVQTSEEPPFSVGCCMKLRFMPIGSVIHNLEISPGKGGKLVRSAGLSAQLMGRNAGYATIRMPSGEMRMINEDCRATFGVVSNSEHNLRVEGKAGRKRWQGIRPTVRGTAMNPVDHPHGGGEGKHKGNIPQTPWAIYTRGLRTRSKKKSNKFIVKDRRKK